MPLKTSKLFDACLPYILSGFPAIWLDAADPMEASVEIQRELVARNSHYIVVDIADGFAYSESLSQLPTIQASHETFNTKPTDMLRAIPRIKRELNAASQSDPVLVVMLENAHFDSLLGKHQLHVQLVQRLFSQAKTQRFVFITTGRFTDCHRDLQSFFTIVTQELPGVEELIDCAKSIEAAEQTAEPDWARVAEAAKGLTLSQAENAFALSYVRAKKLDPAEVWSVKASELKKTGLLEICQNTTDFSQLGGGEGLKHYAKTVLAKKQTNVNARPKSLLFLGVPGGGKSAFVSALGKETGRHVLRMDLNAMRSKYQGESENNVLRALRVADSMEPCILFIDEINTVFAGATSSDGDSGTSARIFGSWLTWLNDHTTDVLVVGTANDVSGFPPAFTRAERFDGTFFFDLPTTEERRVIWQIYWAMFFPGKELSATLADELLAKSEEWTGAEIKACCRQACMRDVLPTEVIELIPVYAKKNAADLTRLRSYARENQCWSITAANQLFTAKKKKLSLPELTGRKVSQN